MINNIPNGIKIVEVGPRDGLQNEKQYVPADQKVQFISDLKASGLNSIEVTSFVRADKIPQMKDAKEVFKSLAKERLDLGTLIALVPNLKGLNEFLKLGGKNMAVFSSPSETFNKKNINSSVSESIEKITAVMKEGGKNGVQVRGYISTAFSCPYEGKINRDVLAKLSETFLNLGAYEISLGDTIGKATPDEVYEVLTFLLKFVPKEKIAMHFHDTYGFALSNTLVALEMGIRNFDSSAGGLGGCPYAPGATGNMASEDIVCLCQKMEIETGVDLNKLIKASSRMLKILNKKSYSKVHNLQEIKGSLC